MTDDLDLLRKLDAAGCLYAKTDHPPRQVLDQAKEAFGVKGYDLAFAAILGQVSGHEWCYCSECEAIRLMEPTGLKQSNAKTYDPPQAHAYCKMTPRCLGHMVRIAKRPVLTERLRETLSQGLRGMIHAV